MANQERYDEFVGLLQRSTGSILAYVNALLLNWNNAEDVFQEVCVTLWQKFDEFETGTNFVAWALRIAQNKVRDFQKMNGRRAAAWKSSVQNAMVHDFVEHAEAVPEDDLVYLAQCMEKLGQGDRHLVETCYGDGVAVREIAETLGRTPQSVHNSLHRIRRTLLDCIERLFRGEERQ
jgi:RNA polymerase sigma-70 factor, ECF subfamily